MCYLGEMALKGLNKSTFEAQLAKAIRRRTKNLGNFKVYKAQSTFYVEPEDEFSDVDAAFERVKKIFGIAAVSKAVVTEKDFDKIAEIAPIYLEESLRNARTFKVTAKRSDKSFPMGSLEISKELGGVRIW